MWRALLFCLALSACSPGPSYEVSRFTGVAVARSGYETIDYAGLSRLEAEAAILRKGADVLYVLNIAVTRSDRNYPKIASIWVPGREITYTKTDQRKLVGDRQEVGYITLDRATFDTAARRGFDIAVFGPRGGHEGHIPAALFRAALAEVRRPGA